MPEKEPKNSTAIMEAPGSEVTFDREELEKRQEYFLEALETTTELLEETRKNSASFADYRKKLMDPTEGDIDFIRKEYDELAGIQEGMTAILEIDLFMRHQAIVDRAKASGKDYSKWPAEARESIKFLAAWQQRVANFLVANRGQREVAGHKDVVHKKFWQTLNKLAGSAKEFDVRYNNRALPDGLKQGIVGAAAAVHFFQSRSMDVSWSNPGDDIEKGIDLYATDRTGAELAVQVKNTRAFQGVRLKQSKIMLKSEYDSLPLEIQKDNAFKIFRSRRQESVERAVMFLSFDEDRIDENSGFMSAKGRAEVQGQFAPIAKEYKSLALTKAPDIAKVSRSADWEKLRELRERDQEKIEEIREEVAKMKAKSKSRKEDKDNE